MPHGQLDTLIDTTDETDATVQQYQEYFGNLYDWASAWSASGREGEGRET